VSSKIFVGNLDFRTTRAELESAFGEIGQLRDVFLPLDRATQRPRGFAFVEFESEEDAKRAIERFNGYELGGRPLRVNLAEDRPPRRPGGGGGFANRGFGGGGGGGGADRGGDEGGGFFDAGPPPGRPKGSRRNLRARKRSL